MDTQVRDNPSKRRFERAIHENSIAAAYYRLEGDLIVFVHVEVPEFLGQGIGTALVEGTLDLVKRRGETALSRCSFMNAFLHANPEYLDVVGVASPASHTQSGDLMRFVAAQGPSYDRNLIAIREGRVPSDDLDALFPRLHGTGCSLGGGSLSIGSLESARNYLEDAVLGGRYRECVRALEHLRTTQAHSTLTAVDVRKLHASMTLFFNASSEFLFESTLDAWFAGSLDSQTMTKLGQSVSGF
ncbi:DUF1810 family protein [Rhizobium sp. Root1220]|uniref:DUF1810 family protein n=1 Tax=Rhizobium sp. Root1220 TaxID=1736432 RepID=UPI0006F4DC16|nr:DUF1810 family protein [Rhizobium sp. Root1220]KQV73276.1 hypothetical protein ASC90_07730 [Rhizobium sp. Root1220]